MAGDTNLQAHERTYAKVIGMLKYGAVACAVLAAFVIWLISHNH